MNDYLIERYSKNDIREFWSILLTCKKDWTEELTNLSDENTKKFMEGKISSITYCMSEIEKRFDLF